MCPQRSSIDQLLHGAVERRDVPGVVAMVIDDRDTLYQGAFGERVFDSGDSMTPDTVIAVHSMTKSITSVAALQLVENGKLSLDDPASEIIPWLGESQVLEGFDNTGVPIMREAKSSMTLRHLLTHTAGFGYEIWNQEYLDYRAATGLPSFTSHKLAALDMPLLFDPGSRWNYGINTDWVGRLIEEVSGLRLSNYMQANIFDPLDMVSTGFSASGDMVGRQAVVHWRGANNVLSVPDATAKNSDKEFDSGGGGLLSTVEDYAKFARMVLNKGSLNRGQILRPETVATMSVNQIGEHRVTPLKTVMPSLSNDIEFFPGVEKTWSLGHMFNLSQTSTGRSPGSLGWAGLGNLYYWIDPIKNIAGVYATQIFPFGDKLSLPLYLDFEKAVYDDFAG